VAVEIHFDSPEGEILATYHLKKHKNRNSSDVYTFDFPPQEGAVSLCFVFKGKMSNLLNFNSFSFH